MKHIERESTRVEKPAIDPKKNKIDFIPNIGARALYGNDLIPKRKPIPSGYKDELFADVGWDKKPTSSQMGKTADLSKDWLRKWHDSKMAKNILTDSYANDPDLDPITARARALQNLKERNINLKNMKNVILGGADPKKKRGYMFGGDVHQQEENPYKLFPGLKDQISMNDRVKSEFIKTLSPKFVFKDGKVTSGPPDLNEIIKTFPAPNNKIKALEMSKKRFENLLTAKLYRDLYKHPANISTLEHEADKAKALRNRKMDEGETFRGQKFSGDINKTASNIYLTSSADPTTIFHEIAHVATDATSLIPNQDIRTLEEELPANLLRDKETKPENIIVRQKDDGSYFYSLPSDYYSEHTELKVRADRARYEAAKLNEQGFDIYNPFESKATMHDVQQLKKSSNSNIKDLFRHYSDEHILKLLNTVAERSNNKTDKYKNIS